jgi:hypothetical protein
MSQPTYCFSWCTFHFKLGVIKTIESIPCLQDNYKRLKDKYRLTLKAMLISLRSKFFPCFGYKGSGRTGWGDENILAQASKKDSIWVLRTERIIGAANYSIMFSSVPLLIKQCVLITCFKKHYNVFCQI